MESEIGDCRAIRSYLRRRGFLVAGSSAISISGLPGLTAWPTVGSVEHELPQGDVTLYSSRFGDLAQLRIVGLDGIVSTFDSHSGSIVVPGGYFADALSNRSKMTLSVAGVQMGGYIQFLPWSESETFQDGYYMSSVGQIIASEFSCVTDLTSVDGVVDIVYSGRTANQSFPLCAYDKDGNFVRLLLEQGEYTSTHVIPDGSYNFIRACSLKNAGPSLILYFRERRREEKKKAQSE